MKHWLLLALLALALPGTRSFAAEKVYTDGPVWDVTFVRTVTGHGDDYIKTLSGAYRTMMDQAIKDGLVVSYKILGSEAANKDDWDMMLMVQYKNMAALDGLDDKMSAIMDKMGSESEQNKMRDARAKIREILGSKLCREIVFK